MNFSPRIPQHFHYPNTLTLEQRTPLRMRTLQAKAPTFPDSATREAYTNKAMTTFQQDGVNRIYQRRYKSVGHIHLDDFIHNDYIEKANGPINISDFKHFSELFHEGYRRSDAEVMVNMGVRADGERVLYVSPFHMGALQKRLRTEPLTMPRAEKGAAIAGKIKPSAGYRFEERHASDLTGLEDIADFAIIHF